MTGIKTYQDALQWLYNRLPYYQNQGNRAIKKDLKNIRLFAEELGNPQEKYPVIHVGGTNGKGSVSHMLASVLMEAGFRVGLYTSPHLIDFRDRIKVNGKPIQQKVITGFVRRHGDFVEKHGLSFFEMTVGMAFHYFYKMKVDVAIVEVGLGGRLDSTNIVDPVLSIITNIDLDHTEVLGHTPEEIALEKAGIIKPGSAVVVGDVSPAIRNILERTAWERNAEISFARLVYPLPETDLPGPYQEKNIPIVQEAILKLRNRGWNIPDSVVRKGLQKVIQNTGFRGRWEVFSKNPYIILDVGHNKAAFELIVPGLKKIMSPRKFMLLSFVQGKDVAGIAEILPKDFIYLVTQAQIPRAMPKEQVAEIFHKAGLQVETLDNVKAALKSVLEILEPEDLLFVGGSTFTVSEALQCLRFRRGKIILTDPAGTP